MRFSNFLPHAGPRTPFLAREGGWEVRFASPVSLLALAIALVTFGCGRGDDAPRTPSQAAAPTPTPTTGILAPPQTPNPTADTRTAEQAASVLRRVAPTDADVPPGMARASADGGAPAGSPTPMAALGTTFTAVGSPVPQTITHRATLYASAADAQTASSAAASLPDPARALLAASVRDVRTEPVTIPSLGDESTVRRAVGTRPDGSIESAWTAIVRRGALTFTLNVVGDAARTDAVARDLLTRLDQRTIAVLSGP